MKTVLLHGLGQTAQDWKEVVQQLSISDVDCPELFSSAEDEISYSQILGDLEQRYSEVKEPLRICGLSLGALLAIDFAIRHEEKVASLILIGAQYKVPSLLIDFQNLIFRCMPNKAFESMGLSKSSTIKLAHSMRSLDFTSQLNNIRCPVTILCGKKDTANLKASKRLKELLLKATLHIVPNAGHELNKYAPNTIAEILNNQNVIFTVSPSRKSFWFPAFLLPKNRKEDRIPCQPKLNYMHRWRRRWQHSSRGAGRNGQGFSLLLPAFTSTRSMNS